MNKSFLKLSFSFFFIDIFLFLFFQYFRKELYRFDLFLFFLFSSLIFILFLIQFKFSEKIDFFSPLICFPLLYYLLLGIGSLRWIFAGVYDTKTLMICSFIGILFYVLGSTIKVNKVKICKSFKRNEWSQRKVFWLTGILYLFGIFSSIIFVLKAGAIPLLSENLLEREFLYDKGSNRLLFFSRLVGPAFLIYFTNYNEQQTRQNRGKKSKILLFILFILSLIIMLSTASRQDLFFLIFTSILIKYYYSKIENIENKGTSNSKLILSLFIVFFGILLYGFLRVFWGDPSRLIYFSYELRLLNPNNNNILFLFFVYIFFQISVYSGNILFYLSIFPKYIPFLEGKIFFMTLSTLLPGKQYALGEYIKKQMGVEFIGGGINPTIIGELYSDFGIIYIAIMMFLYGFIYRLLYENFKKKPSAKNILLYSYITYMLVASLTGGLFSQLSRWYFLFVFLLSIYFLEGFKKWGRKSS